MKVLPVENTSYRNKPAFKSCLRTYLSQSVSNKMFDGNIVRTSTNFFREDLNWSFLLKYVLFNFLDTKQINTYSLGASDGSEAYSFAMLLLNRLPENFYSKFLPITAADVDNEILRIANSRRINIHNFEFSIADKKYHIDLNDYFINKGEFVAIDNDDTDWVQDSALFSYEPTDNLKKAVQFKKSDILTELSNIKDDGNSLVFCRNVLPYLSMEYRNEIYKVLNKNFKAGSLFVVGEFDHKVMVSQNLHENGFFMPVLDYCNIFQKR